MPSFDPFEIQRLDDLACLKAKSAQQERVVGDPSARPAAPRGLPDPLRRPGEVIEIASFQPRRTAGAGDLTVEVAPDDIAPKD